MIPRANGLTVRRTSVTNGQAVGPYVRERGRNPAQRNFQFLRLGYENCQPLGPISNNPSMLLRPSLTIAPNPIIKASQLLDTDRTSRVHFAGGDANLCPHSKLAAIGKLSRRVVQ